VSDAEALTRCVSGGGVAVFPADTVYGLACDPTNHVAVKRLYRLKRRPLGKPSAVMFFSLELALEALPELGERTREAMRRLLPAAVGLLLPNPADRFPLACGDDTGTLGLRVPRVDGPAGARGRADAGEPVRGHRLAGVGRPVLQSSANFAGGPDPRRLDDVPEPIRRAADLVLDGGELPGTPSTIVDLRRYEDDGSWAVVRPGAVGEEQLRLALG
jgi:L-threonylcarbamoyladenylate synthase